MERKDAKTSRPEQRGSLTSSVQVSGRSEERREKIQFISGLVVAAVTVLGLIVAALAYFLPRSTSQPMPVRVASSSVSQRPIVVSTDLQARGCSEAGALKSSSSDHKTVIQFVDDSSEAIRLYWIDYDGARENYGTLSPGETAEFDTYLTHPWLVADASGCIAVFLPAREPGRAVIQ
jgi:hypothetical protein